MKNNNELDWTLDNFIIIKKAFSFLNSNIEKYGYYKANKNIILNCVSNLQSCYGEEEIKIMLKSNLGNELTILILSDIKKVNSKVMSNSIN